MPCTCAQPRSVDYGMKLSSLMSAPKINDVPTMDVLTERELNGLIVQEPDPVDNGHLSHEEDEEDDDKEHEDGAVDTDEDSGLGKNLPDLEGTMPLAGLMPLSTNDLDEMNFAGFFNTVAVALLASGANSMHSVKDKEMKRKPDLALLDDMEARWDITKVVCELTSQRYHTTSTLVKTINSKAYLLLRCQPRRHFIFLLSVCNGYQDLCVHLYDHSGGFITPYINIDRNPNIFLHTFVCIIFSGLECIGYDTTISIFTKMLQPCQLKQSSIFTHPTTATTNYATKHHASEQIKSAPIRSVLMESIEGPEPSVLPEEDSLPKSSM
ncbi:hypothetical protein EV702DRAFT_1205671 [Suillus placidus]|uniref:Fungal-type protein kinase domain-containing protein n=1 Tax=Suillus placidus TaxID=48579 RepID=A0A9P7CVN4_9AGAM|nr:hypothetical protein EV702DRAFT_1205671 [Suillus placidus]